MSIDELRKSLVDDFPHSSRREMIWNNLMEVVGHLKSIGVKCDVWLDGSFLTKKIDPDDIDFVVDVSSGVIDNVTVAQSELVPHSRTVWQPS